MRMIMMCGLPLSGKSTLSTKLQKSGYVRICPDEIRLALHGEQFIPSAESIVWASAELMARTLLRSGHSIIIDATNTTRQRRLKWIRIAKEFDFEPIVYWVNTSTEECLERNARLERLDENVIKRMSNEFEVPTEVEGCTVVKIEYKLL